MEVDGNEETETIGLVSIPIKSNTIDVHGKVGQYFAKCGFVTVVISYRLAPWYRHPAHGNLLCLSF